MIKFKDKYNCCGCEACVQVCPKKCVSLVSDNEGFLYPKVDLDICIDCGLCEKVCPIINPREKVAPLQVWAAQNTDIEVRKMSSSGGIASMLAEKIIEQGGVVFGVIMNEKCEAVHSYVESKEQLSAFRGSKYVQSRIGNSFVQVRNFLQTDRKVLFIGTPCQISALRYYLHKDYSNLYTADFICHGVPSPGVFKWYLQEEINNYVALNKLKFDVALPKPIYSIPYGDILLPDGLSVKEIRFRDKIEGWKKYSFVLVLSETTKDGTKNTIPLFSNVCHNIYLKGFCSDLYLRPACHKCPAKDFRSGSDLTIADFWGQEYMFPEFDNDTGTSCVIIKTQNGLKLFSSLDNIKKEEKKIEQVLSFNPSLIKSSPVSLQRRKFWRNVGKFSFVDTARFAMKLNIFERIIVKVIGKYL